MGRDWYNGKGLEKSRLFSCAFAKLQKNRDWLGRRSGFTQCGVPVPFFLCYFNFLLAFRIHYDIIRPVIGEEETLIHRLADSLDFCFLTYFVFGGTAFFRR